jgi:hypothetical protein
MDDLTWYHFVAMRNATGWYAYVNGAIQVNDAGANPICGLQTGNIWLNSNPSGVTTKATNFLIDEWAIWSRGLTETEITALYNGGAGITYVPTSAPANTMSLSVSLINPQTGLNTTATSINFSANATATNGNLTNMTLIIWKSDNSTYGTNTSIVSGTGNSTNNTFSITADGDYKWNYLVCAVNSTTTLCSTNTNRTFERDTTAPIINITYPQAANYSTNVSALNYTNIEANPQACWYSTNLGVTNTTVTCGTNLTGLTSAEGSNTWQVWANDTIGNEGTSSTTFFKDTVYPLIDYGTGTPINGQNQTSTSVIINTTWTEANFKNITFNLGNNLSIFTIPTNLTLYSSLANGDYYFNATICDIVNNCNETETRSVTVDTISPNVSIIYPSNIIVGLTDGQTIDLNYSASDIHLETCWYNYNGVNTTINCALNTTFVYHTGNNTVTLWANDSAGNVNYDSRTFTVPFIINSVNYNNVTYETANELFNVEASYTSLLSLSASMNYNGTSYPSTVSCAGSICNIDTSIDIPLLPGNFSQIRSFYFVLTLYNGTTFFSITTQEYNQTVNPISIGTCSNGTIALNFTAYDEQNRTKLTGFKFDGSFHYYTGGGSTYKILNASYASTDEVDICIEGNQTILNDVIIAYSQVGYTTRNYFFQNTSISNLTQSIPLYLLLNTASTSFILQVEDNYLQPVTNVLVNAQKCYPGTDSQETVFISRTNSNGLTTGNFEAETALYQFLITNYSHVLLTVTPCSPVIPQTVPYTLIFNLGTGYQSPFLNLENISDITSSMTFNKQTNTLTLTYADTSGDFSSAQVLVRNANASGNSEPIVCDVASNLSAGMLGCNITEAGTYTGYAYVYRSATILFERITFVVETFSSQVGYYGVFIGFFIILVCGFAFKYNEIAGIWLINAAVIFCNYIGLIAFGNVFVTALICISILITAVLER